MARLRTPRHAAIAAAVLCLPVVSFLILVFLDMEPDFRALEPLLGADAAKFGSLICLGAVLLLPVAFVICLAPFVRVGGIKVPVGHHPLNLLLAIGIGLLLLWLVGAFVIDQFPCWVGVPNCD